MEKVKRNRFKVCRLCSSENYELSKEFHREYLKQEHDNNIAIVQEISRTTIIKKKAFVKCWDKEIEISEEKALLIQETCKIIWK